MIDYDYSTPAAYAGRLARYVADPSTIRARTLDQYGRAPSLDECRKLREAIIAKTTRPEKPWPCGHPRNDANTAWLTRDREGCLECYNAERAALTAKQKAREEAKALKAAAEKVKRESYAAKRLAKLKEHQARIRLDPTNFEGAHFVDELVASVAHAFMITPDELRGMSRYPREVCARSVVMRILRDRGKLSLPAIGRVLDRDHSTVCHALNTWEKRARAWPEMQLVYEAFR